MGVLYILYTECVNIIICVWLVRVGTVCIVWYADTLLWLKVFKGLSLLCLKSLPLKFYYQWGRSGDQVSVEQDQLLVDKTADGTV